MDAHDQEGWALAQGDSILLDDPRVGRLALYRAAPSPEPSGPPLLLVHSVNAAASAHEMRPLYDLLSASRPTYALDLPGFGASLRSERPYTPRLMTSAILAATAFIRGQHRNEPIDGLGLSLSCEFVARAAYEKPSTFRSLALVSPTGMSGGQRNDGPAGSTRGSNVLHSILTVSLWRRALYRLLTRPRVIRYFLTRTFGSSDIDPTLWHDAIQTAQRSGAEHAPFYFLSGHLFSRDITRIYEGLSMPVWVAHGVRGDFVDYDGVEPLLERSHWRRETFDTGALPYFEALDRFMAAYMNVLGSIPR